MRARKWLEETDQEVRIALNRVLTAETGPNFHLEWSEFEQNLSVLTANLRIRHAAKHAAILEARCEIPKFAIVLGEDLWPETFELGSDECNRIAAYTGETPDFVKRQFERIGGRVSPR